MAKTFIRQDTQIRRSDVYDDTIAPSLANFETNPVNIEDDLNNLRSQLSNLLDDQAGNWYDDLNTPSALDTGTQRGVNDLNTDLHALERKRVLVKAVSLADVAVGGSDNFVILGAGELPPNTTAAVGAVTTAGTVVAAHGGTFGTHALTEVAGGNAIAPKNFVEVVDGATRDPILSGGRTVYGLLQGESGLTDGATITDTTTTRVQVSFVRINAGGDDLEAVPAVDIQGQTVNLCFTERKALEDLTEQDFLRGAVVDVPAASTVTRQVAYDNQGATPVDVTTNSTLDLEGPGLTWSIRDDLEAALLTVTEGSAGGTSTLAIGAAVDSYDNNAVDVDFASGAKFASAGQQIDIGVTAGTINSDTGEDLRILGTQELFLDDGNQAGSTWAQTNGIKLSENTAEWDSFEVQFGEVSLLNAIVQAKNSSNVTKTCANVTATTAADTDIGGVAGGANLDAQLHDLSGGTFADDHDVYVNGVLQRGGADAAANNDVYPGTSLANGQLRFEYNIKINDVICVISRA